MKLRVVNLEKNEADIEVLEENETLLNPVKQALLRDKDVDFAEYIIEHPQLSIPRVFVRTKGTVTPATVLKRTVKALVKEYDAFEDAFAAELKKR